MMAVRRPLFWIVITGLLVGLVGCAPNHVRSDELYPDSTEFTIDEEAEIEDTEQVREVLDTLYQYREALVNKNFGSLNRLISAEYYDNAGTTHTTGDDYSHDELSEVFELMANHANEIRYSVIVKDVEVGDEEAHIDFEYEYAFQYRIADQETWDAGKDVNRLELIREDEQWRIISGL